MRITRLSAAFTLLELMVSIAVIAILLAILLPALEHVRHKGYIAACASNLHQIGEGLTMYASADHGMLPRTRYDATAPLAFGTGAASADPFDATSGPKANDVTAAVWLLIRVQRLPTKIFICPYDDVNEFEPDRNAPGGRSNFTDYTHNLGYSYADPYPSAAADARGYKVTDKSGAGFAIMADLNPGVRPPRKSNVFKPHPGSSDSEMAYGNSENHERDGQNVLYLDGHVQFAVTPFCGLNGGNIFTAQTAVEPQLNVSPAAAGDSVLLPAD